MESKKEYKLTDSDMIFSKTDLKGKITYVNNDFERISEFKKSELFGRPHNMIRHPFMPKEIFAFLWAEIKEGKEVFAYVVNKTKTDKEYWVFTNVTPVVDKDRKIIAYSSIRVKPNEKAIPKVKEIYKNISKLASTIEHNNLKSVNELMSLLQENPDKVEVV